MLLEFNGFRELNVQKLLSVYSDSIAADYCDASNWFSGESAFIDDLRAFFTCTGAVLAVWVEEERYISALRVEPYRDGYLISCLETLSSARRCGYGSALLRAVLFSYPGPMYAHVEKKNLASLRLHEKLGFRVVKDHAVYVDGSVYSSSCTMRRD